MLSGKHQPFGDTSAMAEEHSENEVSQEETAPAGETAPVEEVPETPAAPSEPAVAPEPRLNLLVPVAILVVQFLFMLYFTKTSTTPLGSWRM